MDPCELIPQRGTILSAVYSGGRPADDIPIEHYTVQYRKNPSEKPTSLYMKIGDGLLGHEAIDAEYKWHKAAMSASKNVLPLEKIVLRDGERNVVPCVATQIQPNDLCGYAGLGYNAGTLCKVLADAAQGLVDIHAKNIIHRDVKPENILVTEDGTGILFDFGEAAQTGSIGGPIHTTLQYEPPELEEARCEADSGGTLIVFARPSEDAYAFAMTVKDTLGVTLNDCKDMKRIVEANLVRYAPQRPGIISMLTELRKLETLSTPARTINRNTSTAAMR